MTKKPDAKLDGGTAMSAPMPVAPTEATVVPGIPATPEAEVNPLDLTCVRCQRRWHPQLIDFRDDGAVCRFCIAAAEASPEAIAEGEGALMRSMGRRRLAIGTVMVAIGIAILSLNPLGGLFNYVATGLLVVGGIQIVRGVT